jgi:hypothetical protein
VGFGEGLSDEDAVTMDDGGGVARFGEFDTPDDIFVMGPGGRECGVLGVTGALEVTAPGGPIGVSDRSEGEKEKAEESGFHKIEMIEACGRNKVDARIHFLPNGTHFLLDRMWGGGYVCVPEGDLGH